MKNLLKRPGFEAMFYTGILLLIVLPAMVFAQQGGKLTISPNSKQMALIDDTSLKRLHQYDNSSTQLNVPMLFSPGNDSLKNFDYYLNNNLASNNNGSLVGNLHVTYSKVDRMPIVHPDMNQYRMPFFVGREDADNRLTFDLNEIGKDGIGASPNFHISAALPDMEKKLLGEAISELAIFDLAIVPELSTGKTQVVFTLPSATPADISFTNSDGKTLWSEKSTGTKFSKTFVLPFSGDYYLVVKQAGKGAVKKVVKE